MSNHLDADPTNEQPNPAESMIRLVGCELASVTFVRDYVQLGFDGPIINALTPIAVTTDRVTVGTGDDQFRNCLCGLIGARVTAVDIRTGEFLRVGFSNGSSVALSLRVSDYSGPEAVVFHRDGGESVVV